MDPFLISLGLQGASAVGSWWSKQAQGDALREQTRETVRRFEKEAAYKVGSARAAEGASGVEVGSGSMSGIITEMEAEYRRQANLMRQAGDASADALSLGGIIGLGGDLGSALLSYGRNAGWGKG